MDDELGLILQNLFLEDNSRGNEIKIQHEFTTDKCNKGIIVNNCIYHLKSVGKDQAARWQTPKNMFIIIDN